MGQPSSPWTSPRCSGQPQLCTWSTCSSSFVIVLVSERLFSHVFLTSLSQLLHIFLSFLTNVNTEAPPALLRGLCLASMGHVLEPAGAGFVQHRGSSWCLLTQVFPAGLLAIRLIAKACYINSVENLPFPSLSPIF